MNERVNLMTSHSMSPFKAAIHVSINTRSNKFLGSHSSFGFNIYPDLYKIWTKPLTRLRLVMNMSFLTSIFQIHVRIYGCLV